VQAKAVFDVTARQQVSLVGVAGQSLADLSDSEGPGGLFEARHRAAFLTAGWRSIVGSATVVHQRAHAITDTARNTDRAGATLATALQRTAGYRADVVRFWPAVTFEAGGELTAARVERTAANAAPRSLLDRTGAVYVHGSWLARRTVTIAAGARAAHARHARAAAVSQWASLEWKPAARWTLQATGGSAAQVPDVALALDAAGLPNERARYIDVTIEREVSAALTLQATAFRRTERDRFDPLERAQALATSAGGVELALDFRPSRRWVGTLAYAAGWTRHTSRDGERFWAEHDQRHALSGFLSATFAQSTFAAAFRGGSNFPVAGRLRQIDGRLFAGVERNRVRRPPYARLDVRATRRFSLGANRLTLFAEVLNLLDRENYGPAAGRILPSGEAAGFSETLLPRFVAAGLRVDLR
jgi:hypothetical protein